MAQRVSLTMIVRNEEASLGKCLASVRDLVDEMVVVDTGSTDGTRAIAEGFGASVQDFPWVDDFSAARNESLRHATGDWVFWLDADEWLEAEDRERLRGLFRGLGDANLAYVMTQRCLAESDPLTGAIGGDKPVEQVRLFRNLPAARWQYRVYEQVLTSIREAGGDLRKTAVVIQHPGYRDPTLHRAKIERNMRLARLDLEEHPDDPYVLYTLAVFQQRLGDQAGTVPLLRKAAERLRPLASYAPNLLALLTQAYHHAGQDFMATVVCQVARERHPGDADLLAQERELVQGSVDLAAAEAAVAELERRFHGGPAHLLNRDLLRAARHGLALAYRGAGRFTNAEVQWRAALAEDPGFALGLLELGEMYLSLRRWDDLGGVVGTLESGLRRTEDAAVLKARGHIFRKEYAEARCLLDAVIALVPGSVRPRLVLSQALLFEGKDPDAAERALQDVLRLDPENASARHNLSVFRSKRGAAPG